VSTDHPIFVPFGDASIAAVVSVPVGRPRGLVVLLQGLGAPRSHRCRLWTRVAQGLAQLDIASVRLDYPGIGDSADGAPLTLKNPPVAETLAVIEIALRALEVEEFGVVGNCLGAATALQLVGRHAGCRYVSCLLPGSPSAVLKGAGLTAPHRAARQLSKRVPRIGSFGRAMFGQRRVQPRMRFLPEIETTMRSAELMLLFLGREEMAARIREALNAKARELDSTLPADVRTIVTGNSKGLRLSLDDQAKVVEEIVRWFDEVLPPTGEQQTSSSASFASIRNES
jgi:pimeloyl-ACP methyl ester carboxylesterase